MLGKILLPVIISIILKEKVKANKVNDYYHIYQHDKGYRGEKFPVEYFSIDGVVPTQADFTYYMNTLHRVYDYFASQLNDTDPNIAIGSYLSKAVLKRLLLDYGHKIRAEEMSVIKDMIFKAEDIVSYFVYDSIRYGPGDLGYDLSHLFKYDESLVVSMERYNRNSLQKWITADIHVNNYTEQFDSLTLPKETYVELVIDMDIQYKVSDSDRCVCIVGQLPMPIRRDAPIRACNTDMYCEQNVLKMPSVAYSLSHRMLYIALVALSRRCSVVSEAIDRMHLDIMCAGMYRETVYLARRGYFYRDLFMEHITLCSLLGYEEFQRAKWFKKTASWIDEDGCMEEFRNFEMNRTRIHLSRQKTSKARKAMKRMRMMQVNEECSHHQMALALNVLAYGMRHAAHYMASFL